MYTKTTLPLHASPSEAVDHAPKQRNLTLKDIQSDSISQIAKKNYDCAKVKWNAQVVESIFEDELVKTNFDARKLMLLEFTQYLEKVQRNIVDFGHTTIFG